MLKHRTMETIDCLFSICIVICLTLNLKMKPMHALHIEQLHTSWVWHSHVFRYTIYLQTTNNDHIIQRIKVDNLAKQEYSKQQQHGILGNNTTKKKNRPQKSLQTLFPVHCTPCTAYLLFRIGIKCSPTLNHSSAIPADTVCIVHSAQCIGISNLKANKYIQIIVKIITLQHIS